MKKPFSLTLAFVLAGGLLLMPSLASAKKDCSLKVGDVEGKPGDIVTCAVTVSEAPAGFAAFGLDLAVPKSLEFTGTYSAGELVEGFDQFGVNQIAEGVVRIGGFTTGSAIPEGASGTVATLEFRVKNCSGGSLEPMNLVDDIEGWQACDGDHECRRSE